MTPPVRRTAQTEGGEAMPQFVDPFVGVVPGRKMTDAELARALRMNLAAEEEAVHQYLAHADATDNELARKVLREIADEERVHAGEFQRLLNILLPDEAALLAEGAVEVDAAAAGLQKNDSGAPTPGAVPTVGDLKG
jgi:rubrerythrin